MKQYYRRAVLAALCGLTVLTLGCDRQQTSPDTADDGAAIREADIAWSKAMTAKQLDATVSYYAEEGSIFPPNAPTSSGKNAIRTVWAQFFGMPGFSVTCHPTKVEVARSGDIGYTQGPYDLAFHDAEGNPVKDHGKYLAVWKKQSDGAWKVVADIFNSDLPPAQ